jgi:hypothetical protein
MHEDKCGDESDEQLISIVLLNHVRDNLCLAQSGFWFTLSVLLFNNLLDVFISFFFFFKQSLCICLFTVSVATCQ